MVEINGYKFNLTKKQAKQKLQTMLIQELRIILTNKVIAEEIKEMDELMLCGSAMIEIDWKKLKVNYPVLTD